MGRAPGRDGRSVLLLAGALVAVACACGGEPAAQPDAGCASSATPREGVLCIAERSCAFSGCHGGGGPVQAHLDLQPAVDGEASLRELLVGVAACEYDRLDLVKPGDPEASWLMIKLDGPHDERGTLQLTPAPDWAPPLSAVEDPCPLRLDDGSISFGSVMPLPRSFSPLMPLPDEELALVRAWIEEGAPAE